MGNPSQHNYIYILILRRTSGDKGCTKRAYLPGRNQSTTFPIPSVVRACVHYLSCGHVCLICVWHMHLPNCFFAGCVYRRTRVDVATISPSQPNLPVPRCLLKSLLISTIAVHYAATASNSLVSYTTLSSHTLPHLVDCGTTWPWMHIPIFRWTLPVKRASVT